MFEGVYTALVTPFTETGEVDYEALIRLVDFQIEGGVDGLVPVGTTGESPTLSADEHMGVIQAVTRRAAGRVKIVAGTGANSTMEALELTAAARDLGCDGTLQVTPYYNKPNDTGLLRHFSMVADLGLPVMLYNVPGRTGKELSIDLIAACAEHQHIVAIKEAGGSVDRVSQILSRMPEMCVVSGDDPLTLPMMSVGARGVVSVASNAVPERICELVHAALAGEMDRARELHFENYPLLVSMLSLDTNPIPIKTAMAMMGMMNELFRLPLHRLHDDQREQLETVLAEAGVI